MAKQMTVAEYLDHIMTGSGKTQKEIADEVGWPKANVLSMMKKGLTKIPIDKAPALARACNVDQADFVGRVMREYQPEIWEVIMKYNGNLLTEEELQLVKRHRASQGILNETV